MKDEKVIEAFANYLRVEKGLSELTIAAYSTDIRQFCLIVAVSKRRLTTAKKIDVRNFLYKLFESQASGKTVCRKLSSIRMLYFWLQLDRIINYDPTLSIDFPQQWQTLPKALTRQEVDAILDAARTKAE